MIGVGAAFDFHAGSKKRAPLWMQKSGLEWAWRLSQEPGRLWRRYLIDDLPFFWFILKQKYLG
jgi:N-acetylglucosaminyldiphosphoundecaprenol N-acetyl-beta-D-mannosaminyltransferase